MARMGRYLKKLILCLFVFALCSNVVSHSVQAANRTLIYSAHTWKVYYDSPDNAKPYSHLHFYKNSRHVYCLRLDNLQSCDGTAKNKGIVPKHVMKTVMAHHKVKSQVQSYIPAINYGWVKAIVKPLLIAGASVLVVVAAVNIFTGPIDDVAAWAALSAALAY